MTGTDTTPATSTTTTTTTPQDVLSGVPDIAPDSARPTRSGPLATAQAQLTRAIRHLGYDTGMHAMLATPRREINVAIPLRRDDGSKS